MSERTPSTAREPRARRLARRLARRAALVTALLTALVAVRGVSPVAALGAQTPAPSLAAVPFAVGEALVYRATFGHIPAGEARMEIVGLETVRGRAAYHLVFAIDGGVPFFRVHDRYESWVDAETLVSLRHRQVVAEGRYHRTTEYELFPDQAIFRKNGGPPEPSVSAPLDDGSFIYAVRVAALAPGETQRVDRYFRPDRNPVVLTGLRRDTVRVGAGTFPAVVVRPTIRTTGLFSDHGQAQVWFSDDAHRYPVRLVSSFAHFTLELTLERVTPGTAP